MMDVLELHLERAEDALARSEGEEALGHLLEAWKECRAEPIIALIHRLSDHLVAGLPLLEGSMALRWQAKGRHALDLPRVLKELMTQMTTHGKWLSEGGLDWLRRLFPADPRMIPVVLASARLLKVAQPEDLRLHNAVLIYVGAPYDVEPLRELRARLPRDLGREAERLDTVIKRGVEWVPPELSASAQARCDALSEAVEARVSGRARSAVTRDVLLSRIYASPEDDEARRVLADVLLEQGDPLGEFITLQFASEPDEARMARLIEVNRNRWEEPLGPDIQPGSTRFARGFPVSVLMKTDDIREPPATWGTVEEVRWDYYAFGPSSRREVWRMLNAPALRQVKTLLGAHGPMVSALKAPGESALQRLSLRTTGGEGLVETLAALPRLRWLEAPDLEVAEVEFVVRCLESSLASRLDGFEASRRVTRSFPFVRGPFDLRWGLGLKRDAEVPVTATLMEVGDAEELAPLLRAATRFSAQALRVRLCFKWRLTYVPDAGPEVSAQYARARELLAEVASAYTRVDWEHA